MKEKKKKMSDETLKQALRYDPIDDAFAETCKDMSDKETSVRALRNAHEDKIIKKKLLQARDDVYDSMPWEAYLTIAKNLGFEIVLEETFIRREDIEDKCFVLWRGGILLFLDTCRGVKINEAKIYLNWKNDTDDFPPLGFTGGFAGQERTWEMLCDVREALCFQIKELEESGTILKKWIKRPILCLTHHGEKANVREEVSKEDLADLRTLDQFSDERIARLPEHVQKAFGSERKVPWAKNQ